MIVVDASALLEVLLRPAAAEGIASRPFASRETLHAPHLLDIEIAQVLQRAVIVGAIDEARGKQALEDFVDIRVHRYPHENLLPRTWSLRHNLSAYDAAYVALAEALDATLLTHDHRLSRAPAHRARVEVV